MFLLKRRFFFFLLLRQGLDFPDADSRARAEPTAPTGSRGPASHTTKEALPCTSGQDAATGRPLARTVGHLASPRQSSSCLRVKILEKKFPGAPGSARRGMPAPRVTPGQGGGAAWAGVWE